MIDVPRINASLKDEAENLAAEKSGPPKKPPLKEVWWGSLNALGKNVAVTEAFHLNPRENWLDLSNLAALARLKGVWWSLTTCDDYYRAKTIGGEPCHEEPGEALAIAILLARGVVVHLQKKPASARVDAGTVGCDVHRTASSGGGM